MDSQLSGCAWAQVMKKTWKDRKHYTFGLVEQLRQLNPSAPLMLRPAHPHDPPPWCSDKFYCGTVGDDLRDILRGAFEAVIAFRSGDELVVGTAMVIDQGALDLCDFIPIQAQLLMYSFNIIGVNDYASCKSEKKARALNSRIASIKSYLQDYFTKVLRLNVNTVRKALGSFMDYVYTPPQ